MSKKYEPSPTCCEARGFITNLFNMCEDMKNIQGTLSISAYDAENIVDLADCLQGEQALEDYGTMLSDPSDEQLRGLSNESILRFYANVRTLVQLINKTLTCSE